MKRNMKHIAWIAAGASMLFTACIGDLDTLPLNPSCLLYPSPRPRDA